MMAEGCGSLRSRFFVSPLFLRTLVGPSSLVSPLQLPHYPLFQERPYLVTDEEPGIPTVGHTADCVSQDASPDF